MPVDHVPIDDNKKKAERGDTGKKEHKAPLFVLSEPKYSFSDVILTEAEREEIERFLTLINKADLIFDEWGLSGVFKHYNCSIILYGASGTGKTLTAHAIANALNKKIVIVNYSEIESKYVGETSKNLVYLFSFAKEKDAVILFDEADALLSKRVTAMYSAADVSVNQTRNVLLKILDDYSGTVIFTTNFIQNFDSAFLRRIFTHVKFDLPDQEARVKLWNHYLVPQLPIKDRDTLIQHLATRDGVTGADIAVAVLMSALVVAKAEEKIIDEATLFGALGKIKCTREDEFDQFEVATKKVSAEYALNHIKGEE